MKLCRLLVVGFVLGSLWPAEAEEISSDAVVFFESKIRPVLSDYCYQCHSVSEKVRGGLTLDSREGTLHGGDSGPAVVPRDLEASLLWAAINWSEGDLEMPPKQKLPTAVIDDFRKWIEMGAPDPREAKAAVVSTEIDVEAGRDFWSFKPPVSGALPEVRLEKWPRTDVDRFVLARLEEAGLSPAKDASAGLLLRRLSVDLIGMIPSAEDVSAFEVAWREDPSKAYSEKVSALLESSHFGERWGRHWLDVARYAESSGKELNRTYPQAWRYRDYVIDSFNADKPYDRFIQEQIAGDLLPVESDGEWQENLIATGFLALGPKGLNERNPRQFAIDQADEQIDTMSQAVLGLTVSCARCHDHKSDPIPTSDYYAMAGIFMSTETHFGTVKARTNRRGTNLLELPVADAVPLKTYTQSEMTRMKERLEEAENELFALGRSMRRDREGKSGADNRRAALRLRSTTALLRSRLAEVDANGELKTLGMGVQDTRVAKDGRVLIRGELDKPAQEVARGYLTVLPHTAGAAKPGTDGSGRLELAHWLTSRENPLTARVFVNRVWQGLFGQGLVVSTNDFGATGRRPSHPELLDRLAVRFMEGGWSVKDLVRELVHSRSYQMSSNFDEGAFLEDPDNVLLWRHTPQRMDAETLRDSMLVASGRLDAERPLGSRVAEEGDLVFRGGLDRGRPERRKHHRSVYLPMVRDSVPESLNLFDVADTNRVTGTRERTNVPGQALYLMNNPFVMEQSMALARRLLQEGESPEERIRLAYEIVYGRSATRAEVSAAQEFIRGFVRASGKERKRESRRGAGVLAFSGFCQSLLASAEFRYVN